MLLKRGLTVRPATFVDEDKTEQADFHITVDREITIVTL